MKYATNRPLADPESAARKLLEIASTVEPLQDGRIHKEKINGPFLYSQGDSPAEYEAGLEHASRAATGTTTGASGRISKGAAIEVADMISRAGRIPFGPKRVKQEPRQQITPTI